jgi:hypothetical protein
VCRPGAITSTAASEVTPNNGKTAHLQKRTTMGLVEELGAVLLESVGGLVIAVDPKGA